jgi:hypothetical protein
MRLLNEAKLSSFKAYARKKYFLNHNVHVFVMLITEEEHRGLRYCYNTIIQENTEKGVHLIDMGKEVKSPHYLEEFFPNVASTCMLIQQPSHKTLPVFTTILKRAFDIPNFSKYKYAILIREEKLLEWGKQWDIEVNGEQATGNIRKLSIFFNLLTHEFLHVVETEKGNRIYTDNINIDRELVHQAMKEIKGFSYRDIFSEQT